MLGTKVGEFWFSKGNKYIRKWTSLLCIICYYFWNYKLDFAFNLVNGKECNNHCWITIGSWTSKCNKFSESSLLFKLLVCRSTENKDICQGIACRKNLHASVLREVCISKRAGLYHADWFQWDVRRKKENLISCSSFSIVLVNPIILDSYLSTIMLLRL